MEASIDILKGFATILAERGISVGDLLREARLVEAGFAQDATRLSSQDAAAIIAAGYRIARDPTLALQVGLRAPVSSLGILGEVALHCPTLRASISAVERYLPLVLPVGRLHLVEAGSLAHLGFELPFSDLPALRVATELALSFALRIARSFASFATDAVTAAVCYAPPSYADQYGRWLGCNVRFDAHRTEIVFPASVLDELQLFVDGSLLRALEQRAEELLRAHRTRDTMPLRVRKILRDGDMTKASIRTVAARLQTSPRALRRMLRCQGQTVSALLDQVRQEQSFADLLNPDVPIKQIAERVGFAEVAAFHRAFRRWTGMTPVRYRREHARMRSADLAT